MPKNIFKDIEALIFKENDDHLSIITDHKAALQAFLTKPKPDTAVNLFKFIQVHHEKETVFKLLNDLRLFEKGFLAMLPDHRDHYLHSASVYVLGLAIYNSYSSIRNALSIDRHAPNSEGQRKSFLFRWALAACLHDIAYPLEIALRSFNKYSIDLHELEDLEKGSFIRIDSSIYDRLDFLPILDSNVIGIPKRDTALGLIADNLTRKKGNWNSPITYQTLLELLRALLKRNLESGRIDHGVFSAFILLNRTHKLYDKYKWDDKYFYFEIVDAATAVFLHNSYVHSNMIDFFGKGKFRYKYPSPLGFLLYLCDSVCEWLRGRKSDANKYGFLAPDENTLVFKVPSEKEKNKIEPLIDRIGGITVTITTN